jgi:hypothetical protein
MTFMNRTWTVGRIALLPLLGAAFAACSGSGEGRREEIQNSVLPLDASTITVSDDGNTLASSLLGGGAAITITSAVYSGAATASGTYTDGPLAIPNGALFTSGAALLSVPPSDAEGTTQNNLLPGDALCDALIPGYTSYDATKLTITFDLAPGFDGISFLSIFGSEEYIEYVGSTFNDVYGVYLNGSQVAFDDNGNPITINGPFFSSGAVVVEPATETEYDGSTGLLQTKAPLAGGSTGNVLEIVICDAGDHVLDSGVFVANLNGCVGNDCTGTVPCEAIDDDGDGVNSCIDCDDANPAVNPNAAEICDGVDNDCDSEVDEGGVCVPVCVTIQRGLSGDAEDAYISPNTSWSTGASADLYTGILDGNEKRTLVKFDLDTIPAGALVQSATFTIQQSWDTHSATVLAHQVTTAWDEATVTWATLAGAGFDPAVLGSFVTVPNAAAPHSVDVTALVAAWLGGGAANEGLILVDSAPTARTFYQSSDHAAQATRPKLEVCYTGG